MGVFSNNDPAGREMIVTRIGPANGTALCRCLFQIRWDAMEERNMVFDPGLRRLRVVCPRCGHLEPVPPHCDWGGRSMHPNRIDEYL